MWIFSYQLIILMYQYQNKYYIVRKGDFAVNGNKKIVFSLLSFVMALDDYMNNNSSDCMTIMIGSTFVWTIIEAFLHLSKTRQIKSMYIRLNGMKFSIPTFWGIFLQGFQEGGLVSTFGLYFGDRLYQLKCIFILHIFIFFIVKSLMSKGRGYNVLSKRQINAPGSLAVIGLMTMYNLKIALEFPQHIYRQMRMFFVMVYVCGIWTCVAYHKQFRAVHKDVNMNIGTYICKTPSHKEEIIVLGYDVIFEIGVAYLTFYNWFVLK